MTIKRTVSAGNVTYTITRTGVTSVLDATLTFAAHYWWDAGMGEHGTQEVPVTFEELTVQQKMNIVEEMYARVTKDAARTYNSITAQNAARITADQTITEF